MRSQHDPLFSLFEKHLFNALVEDESTDDFINRVVGDYLGHLARTCVIPHQLRPSIEEDLREEVLEMLRKRTYGHYNLQQFRKANAAPARKTRANVSKSSPSEATPDGSIAVPSTASSSTAARPRKRRAN